MRRQTGGNRCWYVALLASSVSCGGGAVSPAGPTPAPPTTVSTPLAVSVDCAKPFRPGDRLACTVEVAEGTSPVSSDVQAFADLRPFGSFSPFRLGCTVCTGPLWTFTLELRIPGDMPPGERTLAVWAADAQGRRAETAAAIEIMPNAGLTPMTISTRCGGPFHPGDYVPLACFVVVEPGASPSSSGIQAFADERMFGGRADAAIVACTACGPPPNVFDLDLRIPSDISVGEKTFAVWATDAQGRRADTTATFQVTPR